MPKTLPPVPLYDYQKAWVGDRSRFKVGLWSRQAGKSFATSLEAVFDCYEKPKNSWVFLSAGERQSKELMAKAQVHARAINLAAIPDEADYRDSDGNTYKQLELIFPNGSKIMALPANPNTARGHSANILLDEFAFHKDSRSIWSALFPTVTRGYKIRIISTPQGKQNKFYELWSGNPQYSKHKTTIFDAVSQGLELLDEEGNRCSPEDLKQALGDDEAWAQEYECEFLDEATAFLTYELISEAEHQGIGKDNPVTGFPVYIGVDVGRRQDLTVIWVNEILGDVHWTRRLIELSRTPFRDQKDIIRQQITQLNPHRVCIDATGIGMQLAEELQWEFGIYTVENINFTLPVKEDLATTILRTFQDKRIRIPVDYNLRQDLHSVRRTVTSAGHTRFDAERSKDGHADRFWSLALALHAAAQPMAYPRVSSGVTRVIPNLLERY